MSAVDRKIQYSNDANLGCVCLSPSERLHGAQLASRGCLLKHSAYSNKFNGNMIPLFIQAE